MTARQINKIFDEQIEKDLSNGMEESIYQAHKELFNLTLNFTILQWNQIRTDKYWIGLDRTPESLKVKYTLAFFKNYLSSN